MHHDSWTTNEQFSFTYVIPLLFTRSSTAALTLLYFDAT